MSEWPIIAFWTAICFLPGATAQIMKWIIELIG